MDYINEFALVIAGMVIGASLAFFFRKNQAKDQEIANRLDELNNDFADYQTEVQQHFAKSAELFNQLTKDYVNIHQHLASGAQSLAQGKNGNVLTKETTFLPLTENKEPIDLENDSAISEIMEQIQQPEKTTSDISGTVTDKKNKSLKNDEFTPFDPAEENALNTENS